jgi:hypothetical protein
VGAATLALICCDGDVQLISAPAVVTVGGVVLPTMVAFAVEVQPLRPLVTVTV